MSQAAATAPQALIGFGQVRHHRLRPVANAFAYPTYFLMLPLRTLSAAAPSTHQEGWRINQRGLLSFHETDHGDGRTPAQGGAIAWLDELLPNDQGGALRAIVVEVNNTFGERHCYLLDAPRMGVEQRARKVFHVSPFCQVQGYYRFRFMRTTHQGQDKTVARIDYCDAPTAHPAEATPSATAASDVLLQTSVSGTLEPITRTSLRRALWRYPAMTLGVVIHIHLQALRLWRSGVPFFSKPQPPASLVSR
jgi:DUF1365 family protein